MATVAAAVVAVAVAMTVRLNKEYSDTEYKIEWRENFRPLFFAFWRAMIESFSGKKCKFVESVSNMKK